MVNLLLVMEYLTALGMTMVLLFLDSRYSQKFSILTVYGTMFPVMAIIAVVSKEIGIEATLKIYPLLAHLPSLLVIFILSRFRGWRMLFQLLSAILFCTFIMHGAALLYYLSGSRISVLILCLLVFSAGIIWFLVSFLRPLFLQTLMELHRGWWFICIIMAVYYAIVIYLIPGYVGDSWSATILKPAVSLLMVGFYTILMFLFSSIRKEAETRHNVQLFALQLSSLQSRMEAVQAAENVIRTERHDLHHRLQVVAELVSHGNNEAALEFLDAAQKRLDEHKEIRWCRPPVLDAVFCSYFDQAENQGISVDAKISLPDHLAVNEGELAIVVANALENAIHANLMQPQGQRTILCKMIATPSIMLEICNPCTEIVVFDRNGLPVSQKQGHGVGVQSISAFCQKNGAVCQFELTDGWFRFRLIL